MDDILPENLAPSGPPDAPKPAQAPAPPAPVEEPQGRSASAPREPQIEETPLILEPEGITPKRVATLVGNALVIVLAPLLVTVAVGIYQTVKPERLVTTRTPADMGLAYEDVALKTADGVDIAAWYVPAEKSTDAAVLVLHGYPADKGDVLPRSAFLARTYNLLLIDFRSMGKSGGSYTTLGAKEIEDAIAGVEFLKAKGMERIGTYGFSMGGAVALSLPSRTHSIDAVVSEAAYADLRRMAEEPYRYLGPLKVVCASLTALTARLLLGVDIDRASPATTLQGVKIPILVIHSRKDKTVPFSHAETIKERLKDDPSAEFWFTDDEGHGEASTDFAGRVQEFFDRNLAAPAGAE